MFLRKFSPRVCYRWGWSVVGCSGHSAGFAAAYGAESHSFPIGYSKRESLLLHTLSPIWDTASSPLSWPAFALVLTLRWGPSPVLTSSILQLQVENHPRFLSLWDLEELDVFCVWSQSSLLSKPPASGSTLTGVPTCDLPKSCCLLFAAHAVGLVPFIPAS